MKNRLLTLLLAITLGFGALCTGLSGGAASPAGHAAEATKLTPAQARARLVEGNARFASGQPQQPRQAPKRRTELANSQHLFAVILGCSDSRTSTRHWSPCGAVVAARKIVAVKGRAEGHIRSLVAAIRPAVEATLGQDANATCKANIRNIVHALRTSESVLRHMAESGDIKVVGAYYDLDTSLLTFLSGLMNIRGIDRPSWPWNQSKPFEPSGCRSGC